MVNGKNACHLLAHPMPPASGYRRCCVFCFAAAGTQGRDSEIRRPAALGRGPSARGKTTLRPPGAHGRAGEMSRRGSGPRLADPGSGGEPWGPTPPPFANLRRIEYVFTPPRGDVLSRDTLLNDVLLRVGADGALPPFLDLGRAATGEAFVVPPLSYGFAVYPDAAAPACM